ncbi:TlyA family rRNA (cytidine-2'-O)-methyltransferase [Microbacterium sediminicola]|uniref:TlyA family rRNA (Cytidine-2'-O)-methyltransferase n=1 Tax=Microbacterium sediminicola TaxID=415210 RepID=A0ABP4TZ47_9MICO
MTARLDAELASRGLARSRTHAARLIAEGRVLVDGVAVVKASTQVAANTALEVAGDDHYVSRAAHKLLGALDAFSLDVRGRLALDMGASTGGFTQVLRERGADPVVAVDVGHGQIAPAVAADPGVIAVEGFNVRYMTRENLAEAAGRPVLPEVVVGDLSFISLGHVMPAVAAVLAENADIVLLIKPQFEVGRTAVREGLVTAPALRADAVMGVLWEAWDLGWGVGGVVASAVVGTHGNAEFLAHLKPHSGDNPTEWGDRVAEMAGVR